jgi:hypothetical protein
MDSCLVFFKNGLLLCPYHLLSLQDHMGEIGEELYRDILFQDRLEWLQQYRRCHPEESEKVIVSADMVRKLWSMHLQLEKLKKEAFEIYGKKIIVSFGK